MPTEFDESKAANGSTRLYQGEMRVGEFRPFLQVFCDIGNPGPIGIADSIEAARRMLSEEVKTRLKRMAKGEHGSV